MVGGNRFGGPWTAAKLQIVAEYLQTYVTALKNTKYIKYYIDAFAGDGYPVIRVDGNQERIIGSPLRALRVNPPFDWYHFIEMNPKLAAELRKEVSTQKLAKRITVHEADANKATAEIIKGIDWTRSRAVAFLDPFGLEVSWNDVVVPLAQTGATDVWFFVSIGGLCRVAARKHDRLTQSHERTLTRFLGTDEWKAAFYAPPQQQSLPGLGVDQSLERSVNWQGILSYVYDRLDLVFARVLDPMVFTTTKNSPLFALFFAIANPSPKAVALATRIANHLLERELR